MVHLLFHAYNLRQVHIKTNAVMYHQGLQNKVRKRNQFSAHANTCTQSTFSIPHYLHEIRHCQLYFHHCFKYHRVDAKYS